MNNQNLLFYSVKCKACLKLIYILKKEELIRYFNCIAIDGKEHLIPPEISMVPTMIVNNIHKPIVGSETIQWVERMKFIRFQQATQKHRKKCNKKDPSGHSKAEMESLSDTFSFIDIDDPHEQRYYNMKNKEEIFTFPELGKMSKESQNNEIKKMEQRRQEQDIFMTEYNLKEHNKVLSQNR